MKQLLTLTTIILFSLTPQAQNNYDSLWEEVEKHETDGLPKSALKVVETIAEKAKKDQNHPQYIKTLLYKSKFALTLEEDAQLNIINDFKTEIEQADIPVKNVLEGLLAHLYWQYFQQNRYKFYNRTHTEKKADETDFRTWDLEALFAEIHLHFQNSLKNGLILQQTNLKDFDSILLTKENSKTFRPTLFDLLAHNALEFYKTSENSISKPAYKFEIDNPNFLSEATRFSTMKIESKDSTSLQLQALKIYQDLIRFHLNKNQKALADVDLQRLEYVFQNATFQKKDTLLLKTLKAQESALEGETSALYTYKIAETYNRLANDYVPSENKEHRWKRKEAYDLCKAIIFANPESVASQKAKALQQQILSPQLQLTTESFLPVQTHGRLLVSYRNTKALKFTAYELSIKQLKTLNETYRKDEQYAFIKKLKAIENWNATLRDEGDYQTHTTEVVVPKLNNGHYVILAEIGDNSDENFAFTNVQITDFALVERQEQKQATYQVVNRHNGQPISGAKIAFTYSKNYRGKTVTDNYTTNDKGLFTVKKSSQYYRNISVEVSHQSQTAHFGEYYLQRYYDSQKPKRQYQGFVFTDRSIYRPAQTVYFKGIAMTRFEGKSEVIPNELFYVDVYDVNDNEVAELELMSNEFGSVSGEFILPNSGLNGNYYIEFYGDKNNVDVTHYFSVEEYKRPKFETTFKTVTETFKVNDSITVNGTAKAYAGSNITNAKVVYRVHRKVQMPRWYYWYRPQFFSEPQEIAHGETVTDDKGEFSIDFKALPDNSVDKESLPIFNYEITADVTDLNGETRSATTLIKVGYHALLATVSVEDALDTSKKDQKLSLETKNLNDEFVPATGTVKIYKLKAPKTVLRPRPWPSPDYQDMSEERFKTLFPHDAYTDESDFKNWDPSTPLRNPIFETDFDTEKSREIALKNISRWASGKYKIELTSTDRFGQEVKDMAYTDVFSKTDKTVADNQLFSITTDKSTYEIGDTVELTLASATEVAVTLSVEKENAITETQIVHLNNNKKTVSISVKQDDLGGFAVHYSLSAFNSYEGKSLNIAVPYPKTELDIETTTFRDKLQPNSEETWRFKIKGPQGDKVSAELLAGMYDMSLDQFKPHQWNFNPIYQPFYHGRHGSSARQSFGTKGFRVYRERPDISRVPTQRYDELDWFGFSFTNNHWVQLQYLNRIRLKNLASYDPNTKTGTVNGTILDENGLPLPGVNVIIKGTTTGTQTDFDGNFSIQVKKGYVLEFSYIGYNHLEYTIDDKNALNFFMQPSSEALEEVVVTGYSTQKRSAPMEAEAMAMNVADTEDALQGKVAGVEVMGEADGETKSTTNEKPDFSGVQIRKNLQETAFFFPQLQTDKDGNVSFSFTTPEALTQWKLQLLAHTKTMENTVKTLEAVTQKELMVLPNAPRFLRHGDEITISTKISNLSDKNLSGFAKLELTDAISGASAPLSHLIQNEETQAFSVEKDDNIQVSWTLKIPDNVDAVQYKIMAKAGDFSDGEQNALPVLSNRMLVTETLPMWVRSDESRTFELDKLRFDSAQRPTLKHHKLTLEITSNPAWYAVQALPYLMEYPYDCNEQTFSRYYANTLASHIANSNPRIQEVFNQWRNSDALVSNLEKNEELKNILIQETPWLRDAQSETEQKKRIALLFDLNKMKNEQDKTLRKLKQNQMGNGAWPWFKGGRPNRYITQHIITGFGHLQHLTSAPLSHQNSKRSLSGVEMTLSHPNEMIENAINYLDAEFAQEYKDLKKYDKDVDLSKDHLSYTQLHYLYMRSFFPDIKPSREVEEIKAYYHSQIKNYWLKRSLYAKGLMALITHRMQDESTSAKILKSLRETSITSDELGMYWKDNTASWFWYQAPIETQALLIEAFSEVENDVKTIDNLKIWLLKNKQTNQWKTTKATTEAVYALLLQGSDWLSVTDAVEVLVGGEKIEPSKLEDVQVEAGTGYYKTSWDSAEIQPEMGEVTLKKQGDGIAWGALYWQYFEDLDKITSAETPLKLKKKLYLKTNTDRGEELSEIADNTQLKVGDLVRVRIELRSDRAMEFVHMKDMRASGMEPVNVLSSYKWQDGLGYYESTKDASTNFFFDYLPKGVYVFEYDLRVNNAGDMSNGITTIQSMYAPEFSSHSEGVRVKVIGER